MAPDAPDLSRLRGMAALPSTILLRVSPEELRYLLGAVDELAQLREAAAAVLDGLRGTAILHWPECDQARSRDQEDCDLIPMRQISWEDCVHDVCDTCAARLLESPAAPPVHVGDLPHAAPLRALRRLLGRG